MPSLGFVIEGGVRVYFAGDTDVYDAMAELAPLDVALLPVWGWGPRLGRGAPEPAHGRRGVAAAATARRGADPLGHVLPDRPARPRGLADPPHEFARHAAELAPEVEVRILQPGESAVL